MIGLVRGLHCSGCNVPPTLDQAHTSPTILFPGLRGQVPSGQFLAPIQTSGLHPPRTASQ